MSLTLPVMRFPCRPLRGCCPASSAARARTSSVSSSSRQATAITLSTLDFGDGALVGDREHPHLADLVTPELHPHRMLGGRGEDVENAAADGEFAAPADHVHPGVGQLDQPAR